MNMFRELVKSINFRPPTAIFFNNEGIQYKISRKTRTIQDKNFYSTVKSYEIQGKKSRKYHLCLKNDILLKNKQQTHLIEK